MQIFVLIGGFLLFCGLGMPVAYALGLGAICAALWIDLPLEAVMLKVSDGTDDFALLAIPFFILAGAIMGEGGMAERLVNLAKIFVGFIRGGLALVNILASAFFGCISGSSVADTASIGSVMIPQMIKNGYPRLFAVSVTVAGSLQPLLIPPSHNAVIYSLAAGGFISIGDLFLAGAIPGFMIGLALMVLVLFIARRDNLPRGESIAPRQAVKIAIQAFWGLLTVLIILGGIIGGVFTPTESAAVACIYAFIITMFVYRDYKWSELHLLVGRVVRTVGMVMIMIGFSVAFGYMMAIMQVPRLTADFFLSIADDKYTLLLLINVILLVLGTFMDLAPMLLICTPIFLPIAMQYGVDPVHFGIIMIFNLGIGLLTPPVGPTLVVGCAIGRVSMEALSRAILIFYVPLLIVLMLVTYIPALSLWLPSLFSERKDWTVSRKGEAFAAGAEIEWTHAAPGIRRKVLCHDDGAMLVRFAFERGAVGVEHSHPHKQVSVIESGVFDVTIDGRTRRLAAGDSYLVAPNLRHGAVNIEPGVIVDVFVPLREDFL